MLKKFHRHQIVSFISALAAFGSVAVDCPAEASGGDDWALSLPGWEYQFPKDHHAHPDFKTEWWYFTGNLEAENGRKFGYQLTFFRQGIRPPGKRPAVASRFVVDHVQFVHFAISDISRERFYFGQELARGAFGEAGFHDGDRIVWVGESSLTTLPDGRFRLVGVADGKSLRLDLKPEKLPVMHGSDGVSQKAAGPGRASHYYSFTRLASRGEIMVDGETIAVTGLSWYDHEWATNQLTENQVGWDWFSLQFDDGSELMIFQIRNRGGGRDPFSGGTWIAKDGSTVPIKSPDFSLSPGRTWTSPSTNAEYPVHWELKIPALEIDLKIKARINQQELVLAPISYWEGAIAAKGSRGGVTVTATGYLEMTGYAGPIVGMQASGN